MSDKNEVVVCAALQLTINYNGKVEKVNIPYVKRPNSKLIIEFKDSISRVINWFIINEELGFITSKDRFILPVGALELTGRQNELRFQNRKYLLPEDLY